MSLPIDMQFNARHTSVIKSIDKIKSDDLKDLNKYSPKFKRIIENIIKQYDKQ